MSDVEPTEAGLASGVVNTSFMMGGALGLAVLASLAASSTDTLLAAGESEAAALKAATTWPSSSVRSSRSQRLPSVACSCGKARTRCRQSTSRSPRRKLPDAQTGTVALT